MDRLQQVNLIAHCKIFAISHYFFRSSDNIHSNIDITPVENNSSISEVMDNDEAEDDEVELINKRR